MARTKKKTSKRKTTKRASFIDAQAMARKHPKTFKVPKQKQLDAVEPGWHVKVAAKVGGAGNPDAERFWVRVTERKGQRLTGVIDNDLAWTNVHGLRNGQKVSVSTKNVYDVMKPRRNNPEDTEFFDDPPTEPLDLGVWRDEVLQETAAARADPQLRLLLGARTVSLLDRLSKAPTRAKQFEKTHRLRIDPIEVEGADPGWYRDERTGRWVVQEEDGSWFLEVAHPPGAFTLGEMAQLEQDLWVAAERFARAAQEGSLSRTQRRAAVGVVEAADNIHMRLMIKRWRPDPATRERVMRTALQILAGVNPDDDDDPPPRPLRVLKNRLMR